MTPLSRDSYRVFNTATPNPELWTHEASEYIKCDYFSADGGWCVHMEYHVNPRWKFPQILAATGLGFEVEKTRAWEGFWNESIVEIAKSAIADPETLAILLTGRRASFGDVITCMLESKRLHFDLVALNPDPTLVSSSMDFKIEFFDDLLSKSAIKEVVMYEDRKSHWHEFQRYFKDEGLKSQVHLVKMEMIYLDKTVEEQLILSLMKRNPATNSVSENLTNGERVEREVL